MSRTPFQQGRFEQLPAEPRRPHDYFSLPSEEVPLAVPGFGEHRVFLKRAGSGPPLLLVHGLMTSSYSFRYIIPQLAERFEVLAPDLPGAGRTRLSDDASPDFSADSLAAWLQAFVDAVGIRGCDAVGNSLGGYLCMKAALRDHTLFGHLVNLHSPARPNLRLRALHQALRVPGIQRGLSAFIRRAPERWAHRNVHYADESLKSLEEARAYGEPLTSERGARAFIGYLAEALDPRGFQELLSELEARSRRGLPFPVPLLLVYSDRDPIVEPAHGDALRRVVPEADFVRIPGVSHFPQVDAPEVLLEALSAFLQR
ncbi:MAG: alpha/beta hydrolase [Polyangiaceae bacterium]|nr:alpha/beta hydrolase [Polyangiaceae bacterium]MCW5790203.1 alpha/beta hydrolase [Polyangiaceae bacterium]